MERNNTLHQNTLEYLKRNFAYGYSKSKHKNVYEAIAKNYGVSPKAIYKIAHGANLHNMYQMHVLDDLLNLGIVNYK